VSDIAVIFGKRGSGKTVKARNLVAGRDRVLFYDTLCHDYHDGVVCDSLGELRAFWLKVYRGSFRIIYRPVDPEGDFAAVCKLVYAAGDMAFVVEEVDIFFRGGVTCPEFRHIIQRGRHEGIELVGVTQRPRGFGRLFTSQAERFYVFRATEPVDLDYFRDRLGEKVAAVLPELEQYHYVRYIESEQRYTVEKDDLGGSSD
jgi:hypothetical protein